MEPNHNKAPLDFKTVYESEAGYVWNTLRRLGVPHRDAEDLLHDVFVSVHAQFHDYDPSRPIRPWLFKFALYTVAPYRRRARHRTEIFDSNPDMEDTGQPSADQWLEGEENRRLVHTALLEIDESRRPVFILHELDGVSIPDVSQALGIPLNTAYSRLRLARAEFTSAIEARAGVTEGRAIHATA